MPIRPICWRCASATPHISAFGHTQTVLEQADRLAPAWSPELPGYDCFQSVWAFAHEEAGDTAGAERAIDSAYERDPTNFFAHHVKAHILEMESRPREGNDWLAAQTGYWPHRQQPCASPVVAPGADAA